MDNLLVPGAIRNRLGDAGSDGLLMMFAEAHRIAVQSFERRLDHNTALLTERFERRLATEIGHLKADLLKWSFVFWIGQAAAVAGILGLMLPR